MFINRDKLYIIIHNNFIRKMKTQTLQMITVSLFLSAYGALSQINAAAVLAECNTYVDCENAGYDYDKYSCDMTTHTCVLRGKKGEYCQYSNNTLVGRKCLKFDETAKCYLSCQDPDTHKPVREDWKYGICDCRKLPGPPQF